MTASAHHTAPTDAPAAAGAMSAARAEPPPLLAAVERMPEAFVAVDREWRVVAVNAAAERARGRPRAEIVGKTHWEVWPESVGGEVERHLRRAVAEGESVRFEQRVGAPAGETWLEISAYPSDEGLAIFARDIGQRKRAEADLRASEARFRGLFEGMADGVVVTADGVYLEVNPAFCALTGYGREELIGRRVPSLAVDPDFSWREYGRLLAEGEWRGEAEVHRKDGRVLPVESRARRIDLPGGPVVIGTMRDIGERKELERLREDGLGAVAHDLRNPLAAAKGQAQLLRRRLARLGGEDPAGVAAGLTLIETAVGRATALIEELLDAARLRAGRTLALGRVATDLGEIVRASADGYRRATDRHAITVETPAEPMVAAVDRDRLERVLAELLANAIKYSPDGGEIGVRLERAPASGEAGAGALLTVADAGIGIPAGDLAHVFERYRRGTNVSGDFAGSGIGLAGARQIVEQHGGTIGVESVEGRGSRFTVRLPLARTED